MSNKFIKYCSLFTFSSTLFGSLCKINGLFVCLLKDRDKVVD